MPGRVDHHDAILVEQPPVALDDDHQVAPVSEVQPGAAIGQGVGVHHGAGIQRLAHAAADVLVPARARAGSLQVSCGVTPEAPLRRVGAAVVAAGDEWRPRRRYLAEGGHGVAAAGNPCGIGPGADDNEVVVH